MHERSLARDLLRVALDVGARGGGRRVLRVKGWVAETEALSPEALALHFAELSRGTAAEGASLDLAVTHVEARCLGCGALYLPDHHLTLCPRCGSLEGDVLGRVGLGIDALEVEPA